MLMAMSFYDRTSPLTHIPMTLTPEQISRISRTVRSCGQQAKSLAARKYEIFEKEPGDFVTSVDQTLDRQLSEFFSQQFPNDGIITEENAASRKLYQQEFSRLWCIDPLDGTRDFIEGDPDYAVLVGLLQEHHAIAGWIYAPEPDILYHGGLDLGVWQTQGESEPQGLIIPPVRSLDQYRVIIGDVDFRTLGATFSAFLPEAQFIRSPGSFGLKVMNVVLGNADLYVYFNRRVKLWDTTAPIAIAQEAGLVCCDLEGKPLRFTPDAVNLESLAHQQSIVIGWAPYVEQLLPRLRTALDPKLRNDMAE
jgi:3'(2'), 5'-bisphosphate nucleotidase